MYNQKRMLWIPLVALALATSGRLFGESIPVSYSFTGSTTGATMAGSFLDLTGAALGTINGVTGVQDNDQESLNLMTGLANGTFTLTFPDGDTAFGNLFEDDSAVNPMTTMGPFTQILTFTGGTGEYAGVSGVLDGAGNVYPTFYEASGSGTLTAPGLVATPEPGSWLLALSGCALTAALVIRRQGIAQRLSC
jgi:hypothetical protein